VHEEVLTRGSYTSPLEVVNKESVNLWINPFKSGLLAISGCALGVPVRPQKSLPRRHSGPPLSVSAW